MIPKQLQEDNFKFIPLLKGSKKAFWKDWGNRGVKWNDPARTNQYGVLCGLGNLIVVDVDDMNAWQAIKDKFPKTFTVRTGSGGLHLYYQSNDCKTKRVNNADGKHIIDIQGIGTYVVGPGSVHPNGSHYTVTVDAPIEVLPRYQLEEILPQIRETKVMTTLAGGTNKLLLEPPAGDISLSTKEFREIVNYCMNNTLHGDQRYNVLFRNLACGMRREPGNKVREIAKQIVANCPQTNESNRNARNVHEFMGWWKWARDNRKEVNPGELRDWFTRYVGGV